MSTAIIMMCFSSIARFNDVIFVSLFLNSIFKLLRHCLVVAVNDVGLFASLRGEEEKNKKKQKQKQKRKKKRERISTVAQCMIQMPRSAVVHRSGTAFFFFVAWR
uniref:Uncharacterized protein n=1 Tax=Lotharella oceanica TaxID=641309 RepID=A0A7S2XEZ8_9EUKA|mmetsp:Transcript_33513/g.62294  ORF Transcript_33513/g.62294 Transcript_33513/m.62294 type:complete len:105 (+) Transcript_33513:287-601(+)